jgi:queuine/archaeosine tRNA-ribosyltransferase
MFDLKARYLPALSGGLETNGYSIKCKYTGKPMTFWEPVSMVKYPYMLMSAWYGLKYGEGSEWRTSRRIGKDVFVLGDSGGFQAVTQGEKLDSEKFNAKKVIMWQNVNVDVGLILDVPPFKAMKRKETGISSEANLAVDNRTKAQIAAFGVEFDFEGCLKKTRDNAAVMNKYKANQWLYGVLQGTTEEKMKRWYTVIDDTGDFDGWAMAPKPNDDYGLIYRMMKMCYEKDLGPLHFLQLGGPMATVMIERFSKVYGYPITYDNSTPFKLGGIFRIYQTFRDARNISIGYQSLYESIRKEVMKDGIVGYKTLGVDRTRRKNDPLAKESWKWIEGRKGTQTSLFGSVASEDEPPHVINDKVANDCDCEICQTIKFTDFQEPGVEGALYLILHDLYTYVQEQKNSKSIAFDNSEIEKQIPKSTQPTSYRREPVTALLNSIDKGFDI